jgi:hypothetical protein
MTEDTTTGSPAPTEPPAHAAPPAREDPGPAVSPELATDSAGGRPDDPAPSRAQEQARPYAPARGSGLPTTVLPTPGRPARPVPPRQERSPGEGRPAGRAQGRPARRRARLVVQRVDAWSVFLFSLLVSLCLGVVLLVAVGALYAVLDSIGVLSSLNGVLGEVVGSGTPDEVVEPFVTAGRVLGATAVLAAVDVVLLTALATLGALLYNLCASLTGGIEVQLGERD